MEVVIVESVAELGSTVADAIESLLDRKPDAVLGLATGSSPVPVYDELVARFARDQISFGRARAFLLDEYVGLPPGHPESYRSVIERSFTGRVDFAPGAVMGPDGNAATSSPRVLPTSRPSLRRAASTSSSSVSERTVTSASTSPARPSAPARGSRR